MQIVGKHYQNGKNIKMELKEGKIEAVYPFETESHLPYIAPGLVDLQVNGYKGIDFNNVSLRAEDIVQLVRSLWSQGVTSFCPTIISNSNESVMGNLKEILISCARFPEVADAVVGIHLEGPFISSEEGPRGAHNKAYLSTPDWDLFSYWQTAASGMIKLITLSPELPGSVDFIKRCVDAGVKVAIGHTAADEQQIGEAVKAGATLSTHLGNASHQKLPRHPNYIWDQLATDRLWTSMIADGFHLPDAVLKVFLKVKPTHTFLVSDTTHLAGLPAGIYETHIGSKVILDNNGRLYMHSNPDALAGSAQSLLWCVNHLMKNRILPIGRAWNLGSRKPMEYLKHIKTEPFQEGQPADLVLFNITENEVKIVQTIKSGKSTFIKN